MSLPHYDIDGYKVVSADYQARPNDWLLVDARTASFNVDLPPTPREGEYVRLGEPYGYNALETKPVTIRRNGGAAKIDGSNTDWLYNRSQTPIELIYRADESDWVVQHAAVAVSTTAATGAALNLAGLAGKPVIVNPTEDGFVELTGISGGTF